MRCWRVLSGLRIAQFVDVVVDGAQHTEPQAVEYDAQRTAYLQGIGCRVLRYANNAVDTNFAGVCEDILHNIG